MLVKLSKKGDLTQCDNKRGITLLLIPSKPFCQIISKRVEAEIDSKLDSDETEDALTKVLRSEIQ